ncbi:LuxR C-terminal-related transcriptional regulator [Algihabitans albus]|uniref:LuxR C-terminal-related transcriptional regulator n=1 Tax=Algihabitans albus TaxID=2164067 RepID=UPI000E5C973B|nr:LuxR C-terminal-related transcriptional regulator [Algihabitans albus]
MSAQKNASAASAPRQRLEGFADLFEGHFPGHTMQRLRTPEGRYRYSYVSPDIHEAFGLDPDDLMQRDFVQHEWVHADDREGFIAALERSAASLSVLDEEVRVMRADGHFMWVRSIGHPRRLADGTVIWDGVALDVTDRREALEALERAMSQAKRDEVSDGRFAAIAARDVLRPFDRLQSAVEELRQNHGRPTQGRQAAASVQNRAVGNLIAAFDDFAKTFDAARGLLTAGKEKTSGPATGSPSLDQSEPGRPLPDPQAEARLTGRQRDVLSLLRQGSSNRDIADRLGIGEGTVKLHVSAILRTLGVKNRTMAAALQTR